MHRKLAAFALMLALAACGENKVAEAPPPPFELTSAAMGNYCGMNVLEHPGPKGHIILESRLEPVWFSSARDVFAFTMLPEEPKDISAIYVSDMAKTRDWDHPGATNWVEARKAFFVIGSTRAGGMGAPETVPFSSEEAAQEFVRSYGGDIRRFDEVPQEYVLGNAETGDAAPEPPHTGSH